MLFEITVQVYKSSGWVQMEFETSDHVTHLVFAALISETKSEIGGMSFFGVFQPFCCRGTLQKFVRCSWILMQWCKCLYWCNRREMWVRISSEAISVSFVGSHSQNPGWETLSYLLHNKIRQLPACHQ